MDIQFKIGQVWEARRGDKFTIIDILDIGHSHYPVIAQVYRSSQNDLGNYEFNLNFTIKGEFCIGYTSRYDLVKLISDKESL